MAYPARMIPQDYPSQKPKDPGPKTPPEPPESPYKAILVIVIAVVVVGLLVGVYLPWINAPPPVNVISFTFTSGDNACGTNGYAWGGYGTGLGATFPFSFQAQNYNSPVPCSIQSISAVTPGFTVSGANVPLTVPADSGGIVSFNITSPDHSFSGNLIIDLE